MLKNILIFFLSLFITVVPVQHTFGMQGAADQAREVRIFDAWQAVLLRKPYQALQQANLVRGKLDKALAPFGTNAVVTRELLSWLEPQCPFFFLDECRKGDCPLTRTEKIGYRDVFADRMSSELVNQIDANSKRPVNYVSFASGQFFLDLVILTKTLALRPNAKITVHAIDVTYAADVHVNHMFEQASRCLEAMFPHASVEFYFYQDGAFYVQAIMAKHELMSDVILAVDTCTEGRRAYAQCLASIVQFKQADVLNFLLRAGFDGDRPFATIETFKLSGQTLNPFLEYINLGD